VITFLNTHFDYGGEATTQSACLLRRKIDRLAAAMPVILTGDFNADKDSPTYDTLLGELTPGTKLLYDTFRKAHPEGDEREGTCHDYGRRVILPAIDWILASDHFIITEARVDRSRKGSLFPSDHYPLLATARLRSHPVQGRWS
jgi:endonuclease/exonuclease/phosphatase family metal-dependent hydrolase